MASLRAAVRQVAIFAARPLVGWNRLPLRSQLWTDCVGRMTDSADSSQLWPKELIEQAIGITMNRFDLDATQALKVLRRMSLHSRTHMCVVAEQVIIHNDPVQALRDLEDHAFHFG
jgi:hypothetical protein